MKYVFSTISIALVYILFFVALNNYQLIYSTLISNFPFEVKVNLLISLVIGLNTSMSLLNMITLFVIALLTGINMTLLFLQFRKMKSSGSIRFVVGGSSLLGIVSSGCASCGLPLLALLGLGSSVSLLPLKGYEISIFVIMTLLVSTFILLRTIRQKTVCVVPIKEE